PGGMRFSPLKQISRDNVARLQRTWTYHTGEADGGNLRAFECTPLVVDGVLYLSTPSSRVIAVDAQTGKEIWSFDPAQDKKGYKWEAHRGVAYWEGGAGRGNKLEKRILFGTNDGSAQLVALDANTGKLCADFGKEGIVDLRTGVADQWPQSRYSITSPPGSYKDLVITGAAVPEGPSQGPSGDVRAFDVRYGKLVWQFHTVPRPGERGNETWEGDSWKDRSGANVWSIMSVDMGRSMVFLPLGSPAYDFYGSDRKGQNLFGNSLVALDAATGNLLWYYQLVHHDVWDYDLPAQPNLV